MFSFRKKIFLSYLVVFLLFIALMFPFAAQTVKNIIYQSIIGQSKELITKIKSAPNNEELVRRLKELRSTLFFRVALITDDQKVLYDTHLKRILGPKFSQEYIVKHPEVAQAFEKGLGYSEGYSNLFSQKFAYVAIAFDFHGKTYVMRSAFPYRFVTSLTRNFEIGFLAVSIIVLALFSLMTWLIINHLSAPIQQIMTDIAPYQEGKTTTVPEIRLRTLNPSDDFGRLAATLNSLSLRIRSQITTLTRERNEKEAILESLIEGVVAIDEGMRISYANDMACHLLGIKLEDLVEHRFTTPEQLRCYELLEQCQREGKILTDTLIAKGLSGRRIYLDIVAAPKSPAGAILVLQDQSSKHLMLEMRQNFIANASHELKTPLTVIRGFAETLQDNPDLPQELLVEVTGKIVNNCKKMTGLIKDLLTLSDIENMSESNLIECDLGDLLQSCREHVLEAHPTAKITINSQSDEPIFCTADPRLLAMAFNNLLENAVKYSTEPANVTVTINQQEEMVIVAIKDKGIGIPAADVENIFQRFYSVDRAHSQKMGGSGLGLSIVETVIEKHFGRITVESEVGRGSTFTITLPTNMEKML